MNLAKIWNEKEYVSRYNTEYKLSQSELESFCSNLHLNQDDLLVDFGCGNGDFLFYASKRVKKALGVDISEWQVEELKIRKQQTNFSNIYFRHASFLDLNLNGTWSKGFARGFLHHLTDEEKQLFFNEVSKNFSKGSLFCIYDVIFDFKLNSLIEHFNSLFEEAAKFYGDKWLNKKDDIINTWLNEYPTDFMTWQKIFKTNGFEIRKREKVTSFLSVIVAEKVI